ncbi:dynamin central region family protein (macronuclear) [Tetrahymena thermophila SB210]|uniref:Dynamin central region family protein n=2 Tax=Tetrahymena thermophila TaxID=5911 RepID=Q22AJ4_TETTS|nr:dynamin central region family protein [Tetrahymena thermophila SB210]ABB13594.1 Drp6p [Tetrahymena thermophila]EAR82322.2 dynamin central region family protein [Tetrahymena thermophila SB210]|eukprot:XP_001029985.2 dynamin central region family protein [Tetrahymena thermophila SB210]
MTNTIVPANNFQNIKEVIKVVNKLRDFGIESDKIQLPKIVVIGVQSSGKSSLLEQIVQLDFLPRGTGVVTRCPLEIRLIEVTNQDSDFKPYAYFFEERQKIFHDFELVKKEIQKITNDFAGPGKKIVDKVITLTIYQAQCPTLTLIDLPGMTLNSVGDQKDIERVTQDMTKKYIIEKTTIILCVIPINQDLENSLALNLARSVDENGERTIGVLTMIDIMNPGTNCENVLKNRQIPLLHRYYGMKPRSQKDINENVSVQEAIQREQLYFTSHQIYSMYPEYTGTNALTNKLSTLLDSHIRTFLPSIHKKIKMTLSERIKERQQLGNEFPTEVTQQLYELTNIINTSLNLFKQAMTNYDASEIQNIGKIKVDERVGKSYADFLFDKYLLICKKISEEQVFKVKMKDLIKELGKFRVQVNGFLPFEVFESQIKQKINLYETEAIVILEQLKEHVRKVLNHCIDLFPFPNNKIKKIMQDILQNFVQTEYNFTSSHIKTAFYCYKDCICSKMIDIHETESKLKQNHVYLQNDNQQKKVLYEYISKNKSFMEWTVQEIMIKAENLCNVPITMSDLQNTYTKAEEKVQNTDEVLRYSIIYYKYMDNFRKQISDQIPQCIQSLFINSLCKNLMVKVFQAIQSKEYKEIIEKNLKEDEIIATKRAKVIQSIQKLAKANDRLERLIDQGQNCNHMLSTTYGDEENYIHESLEDSDGIDD